MAIAACQGLYQIWMGLRLITDPDAGTRARAGDLIDPQCQLSPDGQHFSLLQAAFIFRPFYQRIWSEDHPYFQQIELVSLEK